MTDREIERKREKKVHNKTKQIYAQAQIRIKLNRDGRQAHTQNLTEIRLKLRTGLDERDDERGGVSSVYLCVFVCGWVRATVLTQSLANAKRL